MDLDISSHKLDELMEVITCDQQYIKCTTVSNGKWDHYQVFTRTRLLSHGDSFDVHFRTTDPVELHCIVELSSKTERNSFSKLHAIGKRKVITNNTNEMARCRTAEMFAFDYINYLISCSTT